MERRHEEVRRGRLDRKKADVSGRLRPYCPHMTEDEFNAFAEQVAEIDIKYALRRQEAGSGGQDIAG